MARKATTNKPIKLPKRSPTIKRRATKAALDAALQRAQGKPTALPPPKRKATGKAPSVPTGKPTPEQAAILQAALQLVQSKGGVLMIEAGAGTGKTTTDVMLALTLPGNGQYTAFNAPLVAESKPKFVSTRVACNTTHSLAFRAEGKRFAHRLNGHRVRSEQIAKMLDLDGMEIPYGTSSKRLAPGWLASQVMGAVRRFCQSADRAVSRDHFKYVDGIDAPAPDGSRTYDNNARLRQHLLPYATKAWQDLSDPEGTLPFSHDHYVKVWQLNHPVISADYILLDEAQDTAPVMLDILRQQVDRDDGSPCPVLILVGDTAQQIYEWRGAVNALAAFPDAPRLFLTQSFRFGPAIAAVANRILENLEEQTPLRLKGLPSINSRITPIERPLAILCRTNACAVAKLLTAIGEGRKPFLVGGGEEVIAFVKAALSLQQGAATSYPDLACFASWTEVQEYAKQDEGEDLRLMVKLIDEFGAQVILDALQAMPQEADADLVISTAHRSKGREWVSVQLAADFPTLSKCSDSDLKLLYVAVTRAKLELDVSGCPFFTGNDKLSVDDIIRNPNPPEQSSLLPPAPSTPPSAIAFTWSKGQREDWVIRGPKGFGGQAVSVQRKDGSTSQRRLGLELWHDATIAIYQVR